MYQDQLYRKLARLEEQKSAIEREIIAVKQEIEKLSPFSKADKITLFRQLFIGNELVYAKHWVSKDGLKKGYAPVSKTFRGSDHIPVVGAGPFGHRRRSYITYRCTCFFTMHKFYYSAK